jgi:CrcB protein
VTAVLVGVGGVVGVMARYGIGKATAGTDALIWSTVAINVVGSFLLGLLVAGSWFSTEVREGLGVGLLGGFTTFSTFSVQFVLEAEGGRGGVALAYVLASVLGGIAAAWAGYAIGKAA